MTEIRKTELLYAGIGIFFGWLFGGSLNAFWFFYSVQSLGFGENDPAWYITSIRIIRPGLILACMAVGYFISQRLFRRTASQVKS